LRSGFPFFLFCSAAALAFPLGAAMAQPSAPAASVQWIPAGTLSSSVADDADDSLLPANLRPVPAQVASLPAISIPVVRTPDVLVPVAAAPSIDMSLATHTVPDVKMPIQMAEAELPPGVEPYPLPRTVEQPVDISGLKAKDLSIATLRTQPSDLTQLAANSPAPLPDIQDTQLLPTYKHSKIIRKEVVSATPVSHDKNAAVDLTADNVVRDEAAQTVTATGHVDMKQSGRSVRADKIVYDIASDTATATGHVIFSDRNGDIHFADKAILRNQMKDGFVQGLKTYLAKGGRFTAASGVRKDGTITRMRNGTYTTCECEEDKNGNTPYLISANKIHYNAPEHHIIYHDATVELFGHPILWTPYFASGDGQIKQESGFLSPTGGYNSRLGVNFTERYYWAISPQQDATFGTTLLSNKAPLLLGQYRQRFDDAQVFLNGSFTDSDYSYYSEGQTFNKDVTPRGALFGTGVWDMSDTWRSGFKVQAVSDDTYLRQYRFSGADVLQDELYAERFSGRDYTRIDTQAFQDIRAFPYKEQQPDVLPEIVSSFEGEPNQTLGGRWDLDLSAVGLTQDATGQDVQRISGTTGWQRRFTTDFGVVTTADAHVRADAYRSNYFNPTLADPTQNSVGYLTRLFPDAHVDTTYPFAKDLENMQLVLSPEVAATVSPNIDGDNPKIPNEDSQDVELDPTNLYDADRYPGYDRIEGGSHVDYGMRTGLYGYDGSKGEVFLGQSYRLTADDPFPDGSGLNTKTSDYVGQITGNYGKNYGMDYRFDLATSTLASERHEFDGFANLGKFTLNERYLYAKALEGTDIFESRQEVENDMSYQILKDWKLRTDEVYDMGHDPGLRRVVMGVDYLGCCLMMSLTAAHNWTDEASETSGTDVTFRIGLKGFGDFPQTPPPMAADKVDSDFNL
jgi:LPS-assembly protein